MGCFSNTCGLSHLAITYKTPIVLIHLAPEMPAHWKARVQGGEWPFEDDAYPKELRSDEALAQAWEKGQGAAAALGYYDHYGWMSLEPSYEPSYRPDLPGWRLEPGEAIDNDLRLPDDCYAMIRLDVAQEVLGYPLTEQTLQEGVAELLRVAALIGRRLLGSHSMRGAQEPDGREFKAQRALLDFQSKELDRLEAELNAAAS